MGYTSRAGKRPNEWASKSAHSHIVSDEAVSQFLANCSLPKRASEVDLILDAPIPVTPVLNNPIKHIIAIDGGYDEVIVQADFPSATICFFQFGALIFSVEDLNNIDQQNFIDPDDIAKLKQIQRLKLTLPIRNVVIQQQTTLTNSVRKALFDFFKKHPDNKSLADTVAWLIFEEYDQGGAEWVLASCPVCKAASIPLSRSKMSKQYTFQCPECKGRIYITDVLRLHEAVDDELGAGGILGYVTTSVEQLLLAHLIHVILSTKPSLMDEVLFIKDGPLAFFGQTANLFKPMRKLVQFLFNNHNLYLAGLEKSGAFVEHANEIETKIEPGSVLILNNNYIYKYIIPGEGDPNNPYGRTTYYGNKIIFKTSGKSMYVVSLPTVDIIASPKTGDFKNIWITLDNIEKLHCDMYDNSLVPIALVNKLVSLANHPSSRILQKFAIENMSH